MKLAGKPALSAASGFPSHLVQAPAYAVGQVQQHQQQRQHFLFDDYAEQPMSSAMASAPLEANLNASQHTQHGHKNQLAVPPLLTPPHSTEATALVWPCQPRHLCKQQRHQSPEEVEKGPKQQGAALLATSAVLNSRAAAATSAHALAQQAYFMLPSRPSGRAPRQPELLHTGGLTGGQVASRGAGARSQQPEGGDFRRDAASDDCAGFGAPQQLGQVRDYSECGASVSHAPDEPSELYSMAPGASGKPPHLTGLAPPYVSAPLAPTSHSFADLAMPAFPFALPHHAACLGSVHGSAPLMGAAIEARMQSPTPCSSALGAQKRLAVSPPTSDEANQPSPTRASLMGEHTSSGSSYRSEHQEVNPAPDITIYK